jgi:F0F1-type ATP synthase membrane subunit b/b'
MIKLGKQNALHCSFIFGRWKRYFMPLAVLLLGAFPIVGSANDSYIAGIVFLDANHNGALDPNESVLSGYDVFLEDITLTSQGQGGNFHTMTNDNGEFFFVAQSVGDYHIFINLNGKHLTTPFLAAEFMPPHRISVSKKGQTVLISFGLSNTAPKPPPVVSPTELSELFADQILYINCNGNVEDQSEQEHAIENKGVTFTGRDRKGHPNMACFFDGTDYLKVVNSSYRLSNFTLSAWVSAFATGTQETRAIISNNSGGNSQRYGIKMDKGVAAVFYDDGVKFNGAKDTSGKSLDDGKWHHITAVFEGGVNTKLYVDAEPKKQTKGPMPTTINPTGDLYIGRGGEHEGMQKRWRGSLDEIRIINRVLSEDEITKLATIVDLPTGETIVPTAPINSKNNTPFLFKTTNDKGVVNTLRVTPNSDGSFSLNTVSPDSNSRRGIRKDSLETATLVIKDGEMTLIDEELPGVVTKVNIAGNLEITDKSIPDVKLILFQNRKQFAFQSISNPSLFVGVNADGSLEIIDTDYPNITAYRDNEVGNIYVEDEETGTQAIVYPNGKTVATNPKLPNIEVSFNAFDTDDMVTVTNTLTGAVECTTFAAFSTRRGVRGLFGSLFKGIKRFVRGAFSFVGKVLKGIGRLASLAVKAVVKVAQFIGRGVRTIFGGIKNFILDLFGTGRLRGIIGRLRQQIAGLQGQVHTLQATMQQQAEVKNSLKEQIEQQNEIIAGLKTEIAEQAETLTQQAEDIAALENNEDKEQQLIEQQKEIIADLDQKLTDLQDNAENAEDEIPDGESTDSTDENDGGTRSGVRDGSSNQCRLIKPASCQVYGVQDQGANNSIAFVYHPVEQTVTQIGDICQGCDLEAMAIHPVTNEIYLGSGDYAIGHPNGHLYKLDANTGALRSVGVTGFEDISGLTFDDNGTLWGWAKGQGLVILDIDTGRAQIQFASSIELADLSWDSNYQLLYGVVGKELWSYDPTNGEAKELCDNLPRKTEAVKALPANVSPPGLIWVGSHNNKQTELQAYEIATCQLQKNLNLSIGYDDVEGLAIPTEACQ